MDCGIGVLLDVDQSTDRLLVWSGETSWVQPASTRSEFRSGAGDEVRSAQPCDQRRASLDLVRILMRCRCGEERDPVAADLAREQARCNESGEAEADRRGAPYLPGFEPRQVTTLRNRSLSSFW